MKLNVEGLVSDHQLKKKERKKERGGSKERKPLDNGASHMPRATKVAIVHHKSKSKRKLEKDFPRNILRHN